MSAKSDNGYSQKGKPHADPVKKVIARETLDQAIHPTNRQNSKQ